MGTASKILSKIPLAKRLLKFYPYWKEANTFENVDSAAYDKDNLGASIRKMAHALDKDLTAFDRPLFLHQRKPLQEAINKWENDFGQDPTIEWAKKILKTHLQLFKESD